MAQPVPPQRGANLSWRTLGILAATLLLGGGIVFWRTSMQQLDQQIRQKQTALKQLHVSGHIPPTPDVHAYLQARTEALVARYQAALRLLEPEVRVAADAANPQLYFQQRVHEVQRTLERLATARGMKIPDQLGMPTELPPADAVPRFLVQVELIEDVADLVMAIEGISEVVSLKVEDPQALLFSDDPDEQFLTALPVRVRVKGSLEAFTNIVGAMDRARPIIDLQGLRIAYVTETQPLDGEMIVVRYLVTQPLRQPQAGVESEDAPRKSRAGS